MPEDIGGFVTNLAADAPASGPDWWTLAAGLVGGFVVAVTNHFFTRRREWGKWLNERRIESNRLVHESALKLAHLAREGISADDRSEVIASIAKLDSELLQQCQALMLVGEPSTVTMAMTAEEHLGLLAYQSLPLPHTEHAAALEQRKRALEAISELMFQLAMVMRIGARFANRAERRSFLKTRNDDYRWAVLSPVDRSGPRPNMYKLLHDWEVLPAHPPETLSHDLSDYRFGSPISSGRTTLEFIVAVLNKPPNGPWRFHVCGGNGQDREQKIFEDVIRIVTGHMNAFPTKYLHGHRVVENPDAERCGHIFTWSTTELEVFKYQPRQQTAPRGAGGPAWRRRVKLQVKRLFRRQGAVSNATVGGDLRIEVLRRLDELPDHPSSRAYPALGSYTPYTFEIDLSREPTTDEMERAFALFNRTDFEFKPPKTFTTVCTTTELESRLGLLQLQVDGIRQAAQYGDHTNEQAESRAERERERADAATAKLNDQTLRMYRMLEGTATAADFEAVRSASEDSMQGGSE
ncbi:hypothetical protein [Mycobacteroides saopaulense]|uniref:hypothetical protein n=1 Tax=Mycobacteroides saopaulense TaxID=1578165 RepID=UPI001055A333|nr:hypothetical protein [Mycobacteroides saopaulense]